jgi:hypothetical protein
LFEEDSKVIGWIKNIKPPGLCPPHLGSYMHACRMDFLGPQTTWVRTKKRSTFKGNSGVGDSRSIKDFQNQQYNLEK